jgi:hypothetical protein
VTRLPPAGPAIPREPAAPGSFAGGGGLAAVAAAATPIVAAALLAFAVGAIGCRGRPPVPLDVTPSPEAAHGRLIVVVGGPSRPRASDRDATRPDDPGVPMELPSPLSDGGLATLAVAADGRLAAIGQDGSAWLAPPLAAGGGDAGHHWTSLPDRTAGPALPRSVLGATWTIDGSALVLVAGAPGSGVRRTSLVRVPVDGSRRASVDVPLEADGPSVAALPRGVVAFVGRDLRDRGTLARITAAGSFTTLPVAARAVAAGDGLVAIVDDAAVRVGTLADLEQGVLPADPLPLAGPDGIGAVAIAGDGSAVAVVRLDEQGVATRVEILRRLADRWTAGTPIGLDARDVTAVPAWLP